MKKLRHRRCLGGRKPKSTDPTASSSPVAAVKEPPQSPAPVPVPAPETAHVPAPTPEPRPTPTPSLAGIVVPITPSPAWGATVRHQYSCVGAWNCDESILALLNRGKSPGAIFVDGKTFAPLPYVARFGYQEARWHPTDPRLMFFAGSKEVGLWNVVTNDGRVIARFDEPLQTFGPWSGNISDDAQWAVVSCGDPPTALYVVNLVSGEKTLIKHDFVKVDYATISPSGNYYVIVGELVSGQYDRKKIYRRDTQTLVQSWLDYGRPSHFDLTFDAAGNEIAVGVSKSAPDDGHVIKRRLDTGEVTVLTPFGYAQHTSARSHRKPGFVVADFYGGAQWGPYSQHVVLIDVNRPGAVVDLGPTGSNINDYWAEPQPCLSPSGSRVIYASNQGGAAIRPYIVATGK